MIPVSQGKTTMEQTTSSQRGCFEDEITVKDLKDRTATIVNFYDRDVKQITRIFEKQKKSKTPIDYSISLDDLNDTFEELTKIIHEVELKLKAYKTSSKKALFAISKMGTPIYSYLQKGIATLGGAGVGYGLFNNQSEPTNSEGESSSNQNSASPPVGWIGLAIMSTAIMISWFKDYIEDQKVEEKKFKEILDENVRMRAAHEASLSILKSLQLKHDEAVKLKINPKKHASDIAYQFSKELKTELDKRLVEKGLKIPRYLQQACDPGALKRAMLIRSGSLKLAPTLANNSNAERGNGIDEERKESPVVIQLAPVFHTEPASSQPNFI